MQQFQHEGDWWSPFVSRAWQPTRYWILARRELLVEKSLKFNFILHGILEIACPFDVKREILLDAEILILISCRTMPGEISLVMEHPLVNSFGRAHFLLSFQAQYFLLNAFLSYRICTSCRRTWSATSSSSSARRSSATTTSATSCIRSWGKHKFHPFWNQVWWKVGEALVEPHSGSAGTKSTDLQVATHPYNDALLL